MAIQPIDLQTLFSQVDKVAKTQNAQREGVAVHQDIVGVKLQQKTEEQIRSVNQAQNTGDDGTEKVKDRGAKGQDSEGRNKKDHRQNAAEPEKAQTTVVSDPRLGRNIDISY